MTGGGDDSTWSSIGRAGFIMDNLIAEGKAEPMVVAMPAGHTGPFRFGAPLSMDDFVADFTGDVMPWIESHYRIETDRGHRALAGLSMGGAQTLEIAMAHLEEFAHRDRLGPIRGRHPADAHGSLARCRSPQSRRAGCDRAPRRPASIH